MDKRISGRKGCIGRGKGKNRSAEQMIRINPIELPVHHKPEALKKKILSLLKVREQDLKSYEIVRRSLDARNKKDIRYSYMVDAEVRGEEKILKSAGNSKVTRAVRVPYVIPPRGKEIMTSRPVIIGTGPAGLFAGLLLSECGYCPVLLERGEDAEKRFATVGKFWETGILNPESNVSFGEGGAGTFSDGKLNTLVKDEAGRNGKVLSTFVRFGADPEILYLQKPHIGTDRLIQIVTSMRKEIERLGGTVKFGCRADEVLTCGGSVTGIRCADGNEIKTGIVIAATGHSARDTFFSLRRSGILMEAKSFAVGFRIQHPQSMIDLSQFGEQEAAFLSPASYKLTAKAGNRGVYTFCMCPGGYVVNASSEQGETAVNGMSYHGRAGRNANAAVIVTVNPEDYGSGDVLSGISFQRNLEKLAYEKGDGCIPVQLYGDFRQGVVSPAFGDVEPCFRGRYRLTDLNGILPDSLNEALKTGIDAFGKRIPGFDRADAVLAGVESRTSSPVRILRNDLFESNITGFYPCGEGAGYAGGITSAAMDGLKTAEAVIRRYASVKD
jgi:uncharacterized FAD-dependent dehydrogenase